jgi:hypothetical protein
MEANKARPAERGTQRLVPCPMSTQQAVSANRHVQLFSEKAEQQRDRHMRRDKRRLI